MRSRHEPRAQSISLGTEHDQTLWILINVSISVKHAQKCQIRNSIHLRLRRFNRLFVRGSACDIIRRIIASGKWAIFERQVVTFWNVTDSTKPTTIGIFERQPAFTLFSKFMRWATRWEISLISSDSNKSKFHALLTFLNWFTSRSLLGTALYSTGCGSSASNWIKMLWWRNQLVEKYLIDNIINKVRAGNNDFVEDL